jgi:hypothetical protein
MTRVVVLEVLIGMMVIEGCGGQPQAPISQTAPTAVTPTQPTPLQPQPDPAHPLVGSYVVTLQLGSTCTAVPEADRTRKYAASIAYTGSGPYIVTLTGATFLTGLICTAGSGLGCDQFFASDDLGTVRFSLENNNDVAHGGHIVEQLASGAWLEIIGDARGVFDASRVEASGTASVWYCPDPLGYPFPCRAFAACSADLHLTLTRK